MFHIHFCSHCPVSYGDNDSIMRAKCLEKLSNTSSGYVTLGGFGGSITVAFLPAIENKADDYDFQILGNAFVGSAEPGIIKVSADIFLPEFLASLSSEDYSPG